MGGEVGDRHKKPLHRHNCHHKQTDNIALRNNIVFSNANASPPTDPINKLLRSN